MSSDLVAAIATALSAEKLEFDKGAVVAELEAWFFEDYFNRWVDVAAGRRDEGPEFVLNYWGTPMYVTADQPAMGLWLLTGEEILKFLGIQHQILMANGYTHTHVPDRKVRAYNPLGGAIEVIWSRRAEDETEIQRFVVHFECAKINGVWKVVGLHNRTTDAAKDGDSIDKAWAL